MSGARPEMSYLHPAKISPMTLSVQAVLISYLEFKPGYSHICSLGKLAIWELKTMLLAQHHLPNYQNYPITKFPLFSLFSSQIQVSYRSIFIPGRGGAWAGLAGRGSERRTEKG